MTLGKFLWATIIIVFLGLEILGVWRASIPTLTELIVAYIPWYVTLLALLVLAWHFATRYRDRRKVRWDSPSIQKVWIYDLENDTHGICFEFDGSCKFYVPEGRLRKLLEAPFIEKEIDIGDTNELGDFRG